GRRRAQLPDRQSLPQRRTPARAARTFAGRTEQVVMQLADDGNMSARCEGVDDRTGAVRILRRDEVDWPAAIDRVQRPVQFASAAPPIATHRNWNELDAVALGGWTIRVRSQHDHGHPAVRRPAPEDAPVQTLTAARLGDGRGSA